MPENSNMDRVLTLVVTIKDPLAANELWNAFRTKGALLAGCHISIISNGNVCKERDDLHEKLETLKDRLSRYDDDDETEGDATNAGNC